MRFAQLPKILARVSARTGISSQSLLAELKPNLLSTAKLANSLSQLPALTGNGIELIIEYDTAIERLVQDIDAAKKHVHLEYYIFANDATGDRVMTAIEEACARGVICRVLIDALGSFRFARKVTKRLRKAGVEVYSILPLRRRWTSSRIDLRNHRKITTIDGVVGYTGSQNVINSVSSSDLANQEIVARVLGPVVGELQSVFLADWFLETGEDLTQEHFFTVASKAGDISAQVLPSGPDFPGGGVDLLFTHLMHQADKEIVIATPYLIPNDAVIAAMKAAVFRGVSVCLFLSQKSDNPLVGGAQRSYYAELLEAGINIHLFRSKFLHAKHMRIDNNISIIGSSNMDMRSFELNAEIDLICFGDQVATMLNDIERSYVEKCDTITFKQWQKRPLYTKILDNITRLLSDLI